MKYEIKNWREFQHYKDRNPPWIKLHFSILSSQDWVVASDTDRVLAIACMLIGSKEDGIVDGSEKGLGYLQRVAYLNKRPNLKPLVDSGFLVPLADASTMLADASASLADARPEKRREETEEEKNTCPAEPQDGIPYNEIIQAMNDAAGTQYKSCTEATRKLIRARWNEGHRLPEFKRVFESKAKEWMGTQWAKYLRPATLLQAGKFEGYLQEAAMPAPTRQADNGEAEELRRRKVRDKQRQIDHHLADGDAEYVQALIDSAPGWMRPELEEHIGSRDTLRTALGGQGR